MKTYLKIAAIGALLIVGIADSLCGSTVTISNAVANPGDTAVALHVILSNTKPYAGAELDMHFNKSELSLRRIETGPRLSSQTGVGYYEYTLGKVALVFFDFSGSSLEVDSGIVFNVFFDLSPQFTHDYSVITITDMTAVVDDLSYDTVVVREGRILAGFVCGDANSNQTVNISDVVHLINYIFSGGPAPDPMFAGDVDCSLMVNISDAVYLINYIFADGPQPCEACK